MIDLLFSINILKEKLFHLSELNKLHRMNDSSDDKVRREPKDFLSESRKEDVRRHTSQIEHYASQFWNHYYQGERPHNILKNRPICLHEYGNCDPCATMKALMEKPEFVSLIPELDERGEPFLKAMCAAQSKWVHKIWLAETATRYGNHAEAERHYREALDQTEMFENSNMHKAKALMGLANSLGAQNKNIEAEGVYSILAEFDTSLISEDRRDLETDFAQLADHYLMVGKTEKAEELYVTVLNAWLQKLQPDDPLLARCMNGLGIIYGFENQWQKAEELFTEAIKIHERQESPRTLELASTVENLANLYVLTDRMDEAAQLCSRALKLREEDRVLNERDGESALSQEQKAPAPPPNKRRKAQSRFAC